MYNNIVKSKSNKKQLKNQMQDFTINKWINNSAVKQLIASVLYCIYYRIYQKIVNECYSIL